MTTIALNIKDTTQRVTLKALLNSEGHTIAEDSNKAQVCFTDINSWRNLDLVKIPTMYLVSSTETPMAVEAMNAGAFGYIFVPFQPHEACLEVERALRDNSTTPDSLGTLRTLESIEFEHISRAIRLCNGNQIKAAIALNTGRNTLWRKLKKMEQQNNHE
jgi:DNA-binding NtrC family response regulator